MLNYLSDNSHIQKVKRNCDSVTGPGKINVWLDLKTDDATHNLYFYRTLDNSNRTMLLIPALMPQFDITAVLARFMFFRQGLIT